MLAAWTKQFRSNRGRPSYRNPKQARSGRRPDLGNKYFRSATEANYARYLNFLIAEGDVREWEYEPKEFLFTAQPERKLKGITRGCVGYRPDFRVVYPDGSISYHELKGWSDKKSKTKLNRMARYYPEIEVLFIDYKTFKTMTAEVCRVIPNWE